MGPPERRHKKNEGDFEADRCRYHVSAWWSSGRAGLVKANGSPTAIHFAAPFEFGGIEERWTPEDLLLAAIASCYTTTLITLAAKAGVELTDLQVEVRTSLCRSQAGYAIDAIELRPSVKIAAADGGRALELIRQAEKLCLVSRSLSVPVKCVPQLNHGFVTSPL
jgi:organic hydroperoxide reductase OsmC/OhrA